MALASARPDCLISSSGVDYKAWSGAGQNRNVFVRSAASQRLASHKPAASQPLIRGWLITNQFRLQILTSQKKFRSPYTNIFVMKCWPAPDLSQTWARSDNRLSWNFPTRGVFKLFLLYIYALQGKVPVSVQHNNNNNNNNNHRIISIKRIGCWFY